LEAVFIMMEFPSPSRRIFIGSHSLPPLWFAVSVLQQSPSFLVYGTEAILPVDVMWDSPALEQYDEGISEDSRRVDIDGLEEARCAALVQSARYLEGIRRYHDRNVKERSFNVGDLILRRIQNTEGPQKLSSPWEGPFTVAKVTGPVSYRLQTLEGEDISNSWNIDQLCRFYA
jgi:hypothetical protein